MGEIGRAGGQYAHAPPRGAAAAAAPAVAARAVTQVHSPFLDMMLDLRSRGASARRKAHAHVIVVDVDCLCKIDCLCCMVLYRRR